MVKSVGENNLGSQADKLFGKTLKLTPTSYHTPKHVSDVLKN